jgi:hypothetical protein
MKTRPTCTIENCKNLATSKGNGKYKNICSTHHKNKCLKTHKKWQKFSCQICGWNLSKCDRHRIVPGKDGGEYVKGNVIIVCPNCHRLVHDKMKANSVKVIEFLKEILEYHF